MAGLQRYTRGPDEVLELALAVRDMKSKGASDRHIMKALKIGYNTLQEYKASLERKDIESLTKEGQDAKRCELDEQVQTVVYKLSEVADKIETNHEKHTEEINASLNDSNVPDNIKIKLRRYLRYPVEDMVEVQKALLNAVELRTKIWGLDKDVQDGVSVHTNRKIIFNVNNDVETSTEKMKNLADAIVGKKNGM